MKTSTLVSFLKNQNAKAPFLDKLKIVYRPYICPFDKLLMLVNDKDTVFDIGCGSGQFALLLAEFCIPKFIRGIEISPGLIENANALLKNHNYPNHHFSVFDGSSLPDEINTSDFIFMIDVLHHIPKYSQVDFLKKLYAKMAPGSKLVLKDIDAGSLFVIFNKIHDMIFAGEIGNEFSFKQSINKLEEIGFKICSTSKKQLFVYPHYTIIAEK